MYIYLSITGYVFRWYLNKVVMHLFSEKVFLNETINLFEFAYKTTPSSYRYKKFNHGDLVIAFHV